MVIILGNRRHRNHKQPLASGKSKSNTEPQVHQDDLFAGLVTMMNHPDPYDEGSRGDTDEAASDHAPSKSADPKAVSFLGDSENPQPLSLAEATGARPTTLEEAKEADKKPEVALSGNSGACAPSGIRDEEYAMMGQTFSSLVDKDIPDFVRQHSMALSFPQKLMLMIMHIEKVFSEAGKKPSDMPMAWLENGLAFIIRDQEALVSKWLPIFFRQAKFSSFTRKLYRWQFRQVFASAPPPPGSSSGTSLVFGHDNFQRDRKSLMDGMRSVTAEAKRREEASAKQPGQLTASLSSSSTLSPQGFSNRQISLPSPPTSRTTLLPAHLSSLLSNADAGSFQPPLAQQQTSSNSAPLDLLQLLASQHATPQQPDASEILRNLLVAMLVSNNRSSAVAQPPLPPPPPPAANRPDDQESLRLLINLLLRKPDHNPNGGSLFPPFSGHPPL